MPGIIFVSVQSRGVFNYEGYPRSEWVMNSTFVQVMAALHREYPNNAIIAPSIQNYALLPALPDLQADYESWRKRCEDLIRVCGKVIVLRFPGWEESVGVKEEIKFAIELGIPVTYQEI